MIFNLKEAEFLSDLTQPIMKIVDKLEFSFNNFTVAKNWDK